MAQRINPSNRKKTGERPNSIGFDETTLDKLLDLLDKREGEGGSLKRVFVRWPYRKGTVEIRLIEPMGSTRSIKMASRNISNGGLSLLHSAFQYPGAPCELELETSGGEKETVRGVLTRCSHLSGVVHEIGIKFDEEIDARRFVPVELLNDYFSLEAIDPEKISGSVLHVDDSDMEIKLVGALLAQTGLAITKCSTFDEAVALADNEFDLILTDYHLDGEHKGSDLIDRLRDAGNFAPVIATTGDTSNEARDALLNAGAGTVMSKPTDGETLMRAIAETLAYDGEGGQSALTTTLSPEDPAFPLAAVFVDEAREMAAKLAEAHGSSDSSAVLSISREIASTAPALGYQPLATMALEVTSNLGSGASLKDLDRPVRTLISSCKRVRHKAA